MKTNLIKISAALALLTALLLPLGMWGQTRTTLLTEDFSSITAGNNTSTSGSSSAWEGNTNFPTVSNAYKAGGAVRIGTGSNTGSITSKSLTVAAGIVTVSFEVKGWTSVEGDIKVTVGSQNQTVSYTAKISDSFESKSVDFTISTAGSTTVKLATTDKRAFLDNIVITNTSSSTYTVTYNGNGNTSGNAPTDSNSPYTSGATVTVLGNTGNLAKSGYTWNGWNTAADGSGASYTAGATFTINANTTLYANWTYNGGGTGGEEQWVLTSLADLTSSDVFVIVGNNGSNYAMKNSSASNSGPVVVAVTVSGNQLTGTVGDDIKWNISGNATNGYIFYPNGSTTTWLYCNNDNNGLRVGNGNTGYNTFEITNNYIYNKGRGRYVGIYSSSNWRSYTSIISNIANQTFAFYKKVTGGVTPPSISADDLSITYDATSGTIGYSIENEPDPAGTLTAAIQGTPTIADFVLGTMTTTTVSFSCSANNTDTDCTATVRLTYTYGRTAVTKDVTITQGHNIIDYASLPFEFDGGRAAIASTLGLTQENLGSDYSSPPKLKFEKGNKDNDGLYSTLVLKFNERPGELSYDILANQFSGGTFKVQVSTDGVTYTDWATYTQLTTTLQHITFNNLDENVRYIKWIYAQKVNGNVALGNIKLKQYEAPQPYTLSINQLQNVRVYASADGYGMITNNQSFTIPSATVVNLIVQHSDDYVLDEILVIDEDNNPISLTPVAQMQNQWTFYMPNSDVTVSASVVAAHPPVNYVLASTVESGKRYIIVSQKNGQYYAMGPQKPYNRIAKLISVEDNTATVTRSDVLEFTITGLQEQEGFYSIYDETEPGYLYAGSNSENRLLTEATLDEHGQWEITIDAQTGVASIVASNSTYSRNVMQFNGNDELFNCYASAGQNPVYLYQIEDGFSLEITGYTGTKDHYYLISTPVTVDPATVGMVTGDYDLYYFDQNASDGLEWRNYEQATFNLEPGTGYLYAKAATTGHSTYTFNLSGELYDGTGDIDVVEGWNLVGNPYSVEAEIGYWDGFYVMNEGDEGSELVVCWDNTILQPMQAVFCYVESLDDYPVITFSPSAKGAKHSGLSLNLSKGGSLLDRAIVRFDEGQQLPKYQLDESHTKVYIPQDDKDYAVVRSANDGEVPVSFKTEHNGTYTFSADVAGLELDYLHLIDNMTGTDVDLLDTPEYTFEAKTTDYLSRFKLVFSANNESGASTGSATFAYYNGNEWVVDCGGPSAGSGAAILQVVDVNGRVLSSETVNGNATISLNETPGVYMLRLVNGEDVRTQKIVVK